MGWAGRSSAGSRARPGRAGIATIVNNTFRLWHIPSVACDVEYTDEFGSWWEGLTEAEQTDVAAIIDLLEQRDTRLGFPYSSGINGLRRRRATTGSTSGSCRWPTGFTTST